MVAIYFEIDPSEALNGKLADEHDLAPDSQFDGNDPTDYTGHGTEFSPLQPDRGGDGGCQWGLVICLIGVLNCGVHFWVAVVCFLIVRQTHVFHPVQFCLV